MSSDSANGSVSGAVQFADTRNTTIVDLVRACEVGDRVHIELTHRDGRIPWRSDWVVETGDDYVQTPRFRVEVTDEDRVGRGSVTLYEKQHGSDAYISESWTESLNGFERTPRDALHDGDWCKWEMVVSEIPGGGVSTDTTVFPEAPTREVAEVVAKRWAGNENGSIPVSYRGEEIYLGDDDDPLAGA